MIQKFICYTPDEDKNIENFTIGSLLGIAEKQIPFTVNLEKLIHYHVGVFAFTGSGKSNLTSLIMRKATKVVPNLKYVIFDISSEYGINILDLLRSAQSRVILTEPLKGNTTEELSEDYMRRHVCPESLEEVKPQILSSIADVIDGHKIRVLNTPMETGQSVSHFATYGGLLQSIEELTNDKYGASAQKMLIPGIVDTIRDFMDEHNLDKDSQMDADTLELIKSVRENYLSPDRIKLRVDAAIIGIFTGLELTLQNLIKRQQRSSNNSNSNTTTRATIYS